MADVAGWIAPIATMIAAMMTAANLGARVTGWGFVVFTVGAVAWVTVGLATGQTNLAASNAFLLVVDVVGVWRWLGRQARYEEGGEAATEASHVAAGPDLFTATSLIGRKVLDRAGAELGHVVDALIECERGRISYVVVSSGGLGGIGEMLRAVAGADIRYRDGVLETRLSAKAFEAISPLEPEAWPARVPAK